MYNKKSIVNANKVKFIKILNSIHYYTNSSVKTWLLFTNKLVSILYLNS